MSSGAIAAAPRRGSTIATGDAGHLRGQPRDLGDAVAAEHRVDHPQVQVAQPLDERHFGLCRLGSAHRGYDVPAVSTWACRISSPDSPVRTR